MVLRAAKGLSIEWKLPLTAGVLLVTVIAAMLWVGARLVRDASEKAVSTRLPSVVGQLVGGLHTQERRYAELVSGLARDSDVVRFFASRSVADRAKAVEKIRAASTGDSSHIATQFLDSQGRSFGLDEPGHITLPTLRTTTVERAMVQGERGTVGEFWPLDSGIVFPSVSVVGTARAPAGLLVEWRRIRPSPAARTRSSELIGSGAVVYLGSSDGAWTDQVGLVEAPPVPVATMEGIVRYRRDGVGDRIAAASQITGTPWYVVVEFPEETVSTPVQQFVGRGVIAGLVVLAIGLLATWAFSSFLTAPLRRLSTAADAMATGEFPAPLAIGRGDELGALASAFNRMVAKVGEKSAAREESESQWRLLFTGNPQPMFLYDSVTLKFLAVNDAALQQYGWSREEMLQMSLPDLWPVEDAPRLEALSASVKDRPTSGLNTRHRRKDGSILEVEVAAATVDFDGHKVRLVLAHDVTERVRLEHQLRQAQKMEAIGRLAGGVAHDFNNMLAVITSYSELLQMDLPEGDSRREDLGEVLRAAQRGHGLTRQLLAFSRQQVLQPVILNPDAVLGEIAQMLHRLIGEHIQVVTRPAAAGAVVRVDRGQFEQVIVNLALNARDAMASGGRLTIATALVEVEEASRGMHGLSAPGEYVAVSVTDTGAGIEPEIRERIFDPFFTTKEAGKGTGLGLATVYGIVRQSGGGVTVYSERGQGSTFRVYLPVVSGEAETTVVPGPTGEHPRGNETILLVEDETSVREVASQILQRLGYRVLAAESAEAALELASQLTEPLHLVITDAVMPRMDGPTLITRLREVRPGLKAMLMSGYTGDTFINKVVLDQETGFLEKPFSVAAMARRVRELLDTRLDAT